jgi:hypothetical protein
VVFGWVAERLNAPVLKTGSRESGSWVQIPPHPLFKVGLAVQPLYAALRCPVGDVHGEPKDLCVDVAHPRPDDRLWHALAGGVGDERVPEGVEVARQADPG